MILDNQLTMTKPLLCLVISFSYLGHDVKQLQLWHSVHNHVFRCIESSATYYQYVILVTSIVFSGVWQMLYNNYHHALFFFQLMNFRCLADATQWLSL